MSTTPAVDDSDKNIFEGLSESIKFTILSNLSFEALLQSRLVCTSWNTLISSELLPSRARINIRFDRSRTCKKFRKGAWIPSLLALWTELTIHYPEKPFTSSRVFSWSINSPTFSTTAFPKVTAVSLYDYGRICFLDFIHGILAFLPNLHHVFIRHQNWPKHTPLLYQQYYSVDYRKDLVTWDLAVKTAANLVTFKIAAFGIRTTLKYLNLLLLIPDTLQLNKLDIDLSKCYGLPFTPVLIDRIYQDIYTLLQISSESMKHLRLKWVHRVEDDVDVAQYSGDFDPFAQFILMISSDTDLFHRKLKLTTLILNFPVIALPPVNVIQETLIPFFLAQEETMEKLYLSRVKWDTSVPSFMTHFSPEYTKKIELGVFLTDVDQLENQGQPKLLDVVKKVEYHTVLSTTFDPDSINARRSSSHRCHSKRWKRHHNLVSIKFYNSHLNKSLEYINLRDILHNFRHLQELELIDHNNDGSESGVMTTFTCFELNSLFLTLNRLKSLKLSHLGGLTDSGLTSLPEKEILRMKEIGIFYPLPPPSSVPILQAEYLCYLELRDLTSSFTDASVYLALQFLPRLEKIVLGGNHNVTNWGRRVMERRFVRNPRFEIWMELSRDPNSGMAYLMDFP